MYVFCKHFFLLVFECAATTVHQLDIVLVMDQYKKPIQSKLGIISGIPVKFMNETWGRFHL